MTHVLALNERTKAERQRDYAIAQIRTARRELQNALRTLDETEKMLLIDRDNKVEG